MSHERSECRCVAHVAAKNSRECNQTRAYGTVVGGKQCYNPWAVCAKTTHKSARGCGAYNWEVMPLEELVAYADIFDIPIADPPEKTNVIQAIRAWKQQKYGSSE